jgi:hypothetical protein
MPTPTYTPLATVTLGTTAASVTFSSIPATYRDLILVITAKKASATSTNLATRLNGDTGSNYRQVFMTAVAGSTPADAFTATSAQLDIYIGVPQDEYNNYIVQFMDYSATDKHKTLLRRTNQATAMTEVGVHRWANTAAINTILLYLNASVSFAAGSTFSLYGVIA